ncbi:MAG TPA: histone H1 [Terriglobia bacterium]|nr:histone H1 [Terriglobia bacterium]
MSMPKHPRRPRDPFQLARQVVQEATGEAPRQVPPVPDDSPAAVAKRKGASQGGEKRAKGLTPERRREIARKAARARWKSTE